MTEETNVEVLDPWREDVAELLKRADEYLLSRYPPELCFLDDAKALAQPGVTLLGAFLGERLAGIGAIKFRFDAGEHYGEIKRVFVADEARGLGLGKSVMLALEARAGKDRILTVRLETGTEQPEALALYKRLGYRERGPFGDYPDNEMSIFMEKRLTG